MTEETKPDTEFWPGPTPEHVASRRRVRRVFATISFGLLCTLLGFVAGTSAFVAGAGDGLAKVSGTLSWGGGFLATIVLGYLGLGHRENMAAEK